MRQWSTDPRQDEERIRQLQLALTEGLQAINRARSVQEADTARRQARARLRALDRQFARGA